MSGVLTMGVNKMQRKSFSVSGHNGSSHKRSSSEYAQRPGIPHRRKRWKIFIPMIVGAVLLLGVGVFLFIKSQTLPIQREAEQYVDEFLEKYSKKDETAGAYLLLSFAGGSDMTYNGIQGILAESLTWEIIGSEVTDADSGRCVVYLTAQNTDVETIMLEIEESQDMEVAENLASVLEDRITDPNCPKARYECSVEVGSYGSGMKIIMNDSLSSALYGGLNNYVAGLLNGGS